MRYNVQVLSPEGRYLGEVAEIDARDADEAEASVRESLVLDGQAVPTEYTVTVYGCFTFDFTYDDQEGEYEDGDALEDAVLNGDIDLADYGFDVGGSTDISVDRVEAEAL